MTTQMRYPPSLGSLLEDETYKTYFYRKPKIIGPSTGSPPWLIMAHTKDLKWKRSFCMTYSEALRMIEKVLSHETFRDVSIISRRRIFKEPLWSPQLIESVFDRWCGRCRRPTLFLEYGLGHPALKDAPVIVEYQKRCFFCGAREGLACAKNLR